MVEVILLRHGQTIYNIDNLYYGKLDPILTEKGKNQALKAKTILENIDFVYSSDLKRAVITAQLVTDKKIIKTNKLQEMNFGIFEGLTYEMIRKKYPKESQIFFENWKDYVIPKGESVEILQKRCVQIIKDIVSKNKGKKILVSTHCGVIQTILSYFTSENLDNYWKYEVDNASLSKLTFLDDGFVVINYINRVG